MLARPYMAVWQSEAAVVQHDECLDGKDIKRT